MRIAIVSPIHPPEWGWWKVIDKLAERHEITVFIPKPNCLTSMGYEQIMNSNSKKRSFKIIELEIPIVNFFSRNLYIRQIISIVFDLILDGSGYKTIKLISHRKFDVIFCPDTPYLSSLMAVQIAKKVKTPLIIKHTFDRINKNPISFNKYIIKNVDRFIVETTLQLKSLLSYGVPRDVIIQIPKPININRFKINNSTYLYDYFDLRVGPVLLFVGRLSKIKGLTYLIQAFSIVLEKFPNANLVIVGKGPEEHILENEIERLGIEKSVFLIGKVNWEKIQNVYQSADIFILPSLYEQSGSVILEAMACGLPIIVTNVGGIPEVCGGKGIIVEPRNPRAISEAIIKLLQDQGFANKLRILERKEVEENHNLETIVKQWEKVFIDSAQYKS